MEKQMYNITEVKFNGLGMQAFFIGNNILQRQGIPPVCGGFFMSHFGHYVSEETKNKIRLSNIGKKRSIETRNKISNSRIGIKLSQKTKYKFIVNKPISSTNVYPRSANTTRNNSLNKTEVDAFILFFIINE